MKIPYVDIAGQNEPIKDELLEAMSRVITRGDFILGTETAAFEKRFADMCGTAYAVGLNSGMDALVLTLRALGIGQGDEVITAPNSFVASASCIASVGARPVFADVDGTYNLDPGEIEALITPRTRAILPVHLTGRPAAMESIVEVAGRFGLAVVEDAAQAVLAGRHGKRVGAWGTAGCFSLHPLKTLGAIGDGGIVTTNDPVLAERLRVLRNLGLRTRDDCLEWSGNSRLDTLQAAVLLVKLNHLEDWTDRRRQNAAFYRKRLAALPGLTLPTDQPEEFQVYHTFVVIAERRDALKDYLAKRGVGTSIHYPTPIHLQTAARSLGYEAGDFPVAEGQAARILSLPVHQNLTTDELEFVCQAITDFTHEVSSN